jgi:hypothetical protein
MGEDVRLLTVGHGVADAATMCVPRRGSRRNPDTTRDAMSGWVCGDLGAVSDTLPASHRSGLAQMPRSCMSWICGSITFSRYSACFIGARSR